MVGYNENISIVTCKYLTQFNTILDEMIEQMNTAKLTKSISHNFIVQMIPHHRAAIEMSRNILNYTTLIPLQNIAINIIKEQTESIKNMNDILSRCSVLCNTENEICIYQNHYCPIVQVMFRDMKQACTTNNINANFMHEMIPHHIGAIQLSENALQFNICPELRPILQSIINSQKMGVQKMEFLLQCICS